MCLIFNTHILFPSIFENLESFYVFGGERYARQISLLVGYRLTKVGELAFDHTFGSASKMSEARIFIQ